MEILYKFKAYWKKIGPGVVTGAADDDPSGIATYSQAGAAHGFMFTWMALFTFPFMAIIQEMCARLGIVTGRGLASAIRTYMPRYVLYTTTILLVVANTFNIGADMSAVGEAVQLLLPNVSLVTIVLFFTIFSLTLQIFVPYYKYAHYIKYLSFSLLFYVATAFIVDMDWWDVLHHVVVPHIEWDRESIILICALLGTTISPYLFFWQTSQEVEERRSAKELHNDFDTVDISIRNDIAISDMRFDVWSGMLFSNLVMFFIIAVCGSVLHTSGITSIETAGDAAKALLPIAGNKAYLLFTLGIVGTGLLAVPILAGSSAYALAETFDIKQGLGYSYKEAKTFYLIIISSMMLGILMIFSNIPAMKALFYSAILNGAIAPILLFVIVYIASQEKIMGAWKNSPLQKHLGWFITAIMAVASIFTLILLVV
jgi:NRAMP (natural resistance-associated macrophage protein)-like metal ion transporter